jgi:hypothetical protein
MSATRRSPGIEASNGSSLPKYMAVWAVAGLVIALLLLALPDELSYALSDLRLVIWPSSVFLLVTAGIEHSGQAYLILAVAIAANGLLYAVLGALAWLALKLLRRASRPQES